MKNPVKLLLLPVLLLFLNSCLTSNQEADTSNRLVITFQFAGINDEMVVQDDTLRIRNLRFLYGQTTVNNSNDTLTINDNIIQVTHQLSNSEVKGLANGTFQSNEVYSSLNFEIKQAEQPEEGDGSNFDVDAFIEGDADNQRYSMIIEGSYNGDSFVFKSTRNFNFTFPIEDNSNGTAGNLIYNLPMRTDVSGWFANTAEGGLLNPADPSNATAINNQIESSVILQ